MLRTPEQVQELRKKLYQKAKQEKEFRFYALYDKVYRKDIIGFAYRLVSAKKGAPGIDGITFEAIEGMDGGAVRYCETLIEELKNRSYKPMPVKRVYIPKPDGNKRPLGIPTIKDRGRWRSKSSSNQYSRQIFNAVPTASGREEAPTRRWTR